jgi:hypothetical protein
MTAVDASILDAIEWLCRRFQLLTGRSNVWLAVQFTNLSIVLYFAWTVASFWGSPVVPRAVLALFCGGLLYVLTQTVLLEPVEAYEQSAYRRVAKGLRNPRRLRDAPLRISFLGMSVMLFYPMLLVYRTLGHRTVAVGYFLLVLTTLVLYVLACDPLPPCEGRMRSWIAALALRASATPRRSAPQLSPQRRMALLDPSAGWRQADSAEFDSVAAGCHHPGKQLHSLEFQTTRP